MLRSLVLVLLFCLCVAGGADARSAPGRGGGEFGFGGAYYRPGGSAGVGGMPYVPGYWPTYYRVWYYEDAYGDRVYFRVTR